MCVCIGKIVLFLKCNGDCATIIMSSSWDPLIIGCREYPIDAIPVEMNTKRHLVAAVCDICWDVLYVSNNPLSSCEQVLLLFVRNGMCRTCSLQTMAIITFEKNKMEGARKRKVQLYGTDDFWVRQNCLSYLFYKFIGYLFVHFDDTWSFSCNLDMLEKLAFNMLIKLFLYHF